MLADAVDAWDDLTPAERSTLLEVLLEEALDGRWRRAVALTRRVVPPGVEAALLPAGSSLADPPAALVAALTPPLVDACVAVHCARPGRLYAVSTRDRTSPWERVAALAVTGGYWALLPSAFGHFSEEEDDAAVCTMVAAAMRADPEATFGLLMAETMHRNREHLAGGWRYLLDHAPDPGTRDRWLDEVAAAASAIFEERDDVKELFPAPSLTAEVFHRLPGDITLESFAAQLLRVGAGFAKELETKAFQLIELMLERSPPRILGVVDVVFAALRREFAVPPDLEAVVQAIRVSIIEAAQPIRRRWDVEPAIHDWVDPGAS